VSTRLVILGLLRDRHLYGYEIKHIIEDHMGDWTSIAFGSIYFALRKLTEEDYIEKVGTETHGDNPARIIYQITDRGRDEFLHLLRDNWAKPERQYFAFDIGLFFMDALPRDEVIGYLRQREAYLDQVLTHLEAHRTEQMADPKVPPRAMAIFDHSVVHFRAELEWTRSLLENVERGEY
jgi:DNA-binding PadR family transcriptional regulator